MKSQPEPDQAPPAVPGEPPMIVAQDLARWYGQVAGLTSLDLVVPAGITGLLGPNGAGKSTFLRLATGMMKPSSGTIRVLGRNPQTDPHLFTELGFCSEHDVLFEDMTPVEMVSMLARASGFRRAEARERAEAALQRAGIDHARNRRCAGFSKGMRQRVRLAASIVHGPKLLLLDEPMTGLDPVGRKAVVDLVLELAEDGLSVVFSSHILHEVEAVARHVVVIQKGMLLAEGSLREIQEALSDYDFTLDIHCSAPRELAGHLVPLSSVRSVHIDEDEQKVTVSTASARELMHEVPRVALEQQIAITEMSCPNENLEMLFRRLVR